MSNPCKSPFKGRGSAVVVVLLIIFVILVIFLVGPRNWGALSGDRDEIQKAVGVVETQQ